MQAALGWQWLPDLLAVIIDPSKDNGGLLCLD